MELLGAAPLHKWDCVLSISRSGLATGLYRSIQGYTHLLIASHNIAEHSHKITQIGEVINEKAEVSNRKLLRTHQIPQGSRINPVPNITIDR